MTAIEVKTPARRLITGVLAAGAMLALYAAGTVATTSVVMTAGISSAVAQPPPRPARPGRPGPRPRRGPGPGVGAAVGIGAAIVGGMIAADQARRSRQYDDAVEYCIQRFRSYNPETGYYMGFDGQPHPCP